MADDLHAAANARGYGSGKAVIDRSYSEAMLLSRLPHPLRLPPVKATSEQIGINWLIASAGNSTSDGHDWLVVTDNVQASRLADSAVGADAKEDAQLLADLWNAYRLGLLVRKDAP